MKKLSLFLFTILLLHTSIYTSDSTDTCDSETSFTFLQKHSALRAPACERELATPSPEKATAIRNIKIHLLEKTLNQARREMGGRLFDAIPEYKKQKDPKLAFMRDYCFSELEILVKYHKDFCFPFDHKRAIAKIVEVAPDITNTAFEGYQADEIERKKYCN